jgi:glycosyltransferase involved in cell wall biosynthesis
MKAEWISNPFDASELFVYLNPGFTSNYGYYVNHAINIIPEIEKRRVALLHLANKEIDRSLINVFKLVPFFEHRPHEIMIGREAIVNDPIIDFKNRLLILADFLNDNKKSSFNRITFYMYSGHPLYASAFSDILPLLQNLNAKICAHFNFLYNEPELGLGQPTKKIHDVLSECNRYLEQRDPQRMIRLYVDCPLAVPAYEVFFDRDIDILPAATAIQLTKKHAPKREDPKRPWLTFLPLFRKSKNCKRHNGIRIGYMGYPIEKYGYDLVRCLYDSLINNRPKVDFQFIVRHQTFSNNKLLKKIDKWKRKKNRITHYTGFMSHEDYYNMLHSSDIMLIPYAREHYPIQSSGVFIESVSLGKVVIVPAKTWFADVVNQAECGKVFKSGEKESLEQATRQAIKEFPQLQVNARRYAKIFSNYWTAKNFLNYLGVGCGEDCPELIRL